MIALQFVAAVLARPACHSGGLDPFGDNPGLHQFAQGDDHLDQFLVLRQTLDEATVDLDTIDRHSTQTREIGIPNSKVVDRDANSEQAYIV